MIVISLWIFSAAQQQNKIEIASVELELYKIYQEFANMRLCRQGVRFLSLLSYYLYQYEPGGDNAFYYCVVYTTHPITSDCVVQVAAAAADL